jgi:hypothetical protein
MTFLRLLAKVELRAFAAVLVVAGAVSIVVYASALRSPASMLPASDWPKLAFLYVLAVGLPIAALVGAPAYAILQFNRLVSWPAVFALGLLPGAIVLLVTAAGDDLGFWFAGCGVAVAGLTHLMSRALPENCTQRSAGGKP